MPFQHSRQFFSTVERKAGHTKNSSAFVMVEATDAEKDESIRAFEALGVCQQLAESCAALGWKTPSPIQEEAVPHLLQGITPSFSGRWTCLSTCTQAISELLSFYLDRILYVYGAILILEIWCMQAEM
jgi:hypothetical protein